MSTELELWFDRDLGHVSRRGAAMLYAAHSGTVWSVLSMDLVYPDDLEQESDQLLGHYGASAHGLGHLLLGVGVHLSPSLEQWATTQHIPAAQLGSWAPRLVSIDGAGQLALARDFDDLRVFATTTAGQQVTILAPSTENVVRLVHRDDLKPSPPVWEQQAG